MAAPVVSLQNIHLSFGGTPLLTGAELLLSPGERIALVGRNGSGKSTLMKIAAGLITPDSGKVFVQPGTLVRTLEQEPDLAGHATVADYVNSDLGPLGDEYSGLRLIKDLELDAGQAPGELSGGEIRRAALARALAANPDILLLDEPTNHLDVAAIEWLEAELNARRSALIVISHDRRFLQNMTRSVVWLDRGETRRLERSFSAFEAWRDDILEQEALDQHKLDRKIAAEEHWLRYGVTARRKRNVGRLARLQDLRQARKDWRGPAGNAVLDAGESAASGKLVVEAKNISFVFTDDPVVKNFSIRIQRGDRVGLAGPNGVGKTTLVRLLIGDLEPAAGSVRLGSNLDIQLLDQKRMQLDPKLSLKDSLTGGGTDLIEVNGTSRHVVSYMKDYLFTPEQAGTAVGRLSGGERARVALAKALARPSNLLILDEPTNDLDLETLDLLEEMLSDYPGTLILVSHDRDFLDRIATVTIAPEGAGEWGIFAGGYTDMLSQREAGKSQAPQSNSSMALASTPGKGPVEEKNVAATKRKLSFNQVHALKVLPDEIAGLASRIAGIESTLARADAYQRDPARFADLSAQLEQLNAEKARKEEAWLELEILQEDLKGASRG